MQNVRNNVILRNDIERRAFMKTHLVSIKLLLNYVSYAKQIENYNTIFDNLALFFRFKC